MKHELGKAYEPQLVEDALYKQWMDSGFFNPDACVKKGITPADAQPFSMVLPPPNVTGTLHLGHAVMLAIQDTIIRFWRMRGRKTLWVPGVDHAAIATQSKVESLMKKTEGKTRYDFSREDFLDRVRAFAQESHDTIVNQMKKMGASIDWSREAYTLDSARNKAVNEAFYRMYEDGLIYRGFRVVNWDPVGFTTVSDDEVEHKEVSATMYTFSYSQDFPIKISTTRPETKVGDTAVAVHPHDERYQQYIGQTFTIQNFAGVQLTIRVIADEQVDPTFGTGALGVTPAHSTIDADMAIKHDLDSVQVIDEYGRMTEQAGELVQFQTTLEARATIVSWLKENKLLIGEEMITQNISVAERSGAVIEPIPKRQWFIDVKKEFSRSGKQESLKSLMQKAVGEKQINIIPDRFNKIYFHWIDILRDWCISRQIWFGHQIPAWYCLVCDAEHIEVKIKTNIGTEKSPIFSGRVSALLQMFSPGVLAHEIEYVMDVSQANPLVQRDAHACPKCGGSDLVQDPDTLDTWFSSGLWTFSVLGWPDETEDMRAYHPTDLLETGYDILFFWVARMILMSEYLLDDIPFRNVYLHGLVRDEQGKKMSKSLGNIIDPLDMIEKYGTDATRLALMFGVTPGNDSRLSEEKIAGFRNFTNKLYNISRYVLGATDDIDVALTIDQQYYDQCSWQDQWILGRLKIVSEEYTRAMELYDISGALDVLKQFTWNEFADWYIEMSKIESNHNVLRYVLDTVLKLWHPAMPFVTEYMWQNMYVGNMLMVASWPQHNFVLSERAMQKSVMVQSWITELRKAKVDGGKIGQLCDATIVFSEVEAIDSTDQMIIKKLAGLSRLEMMKGEQSRMTGIKKVAHGAIIIVHVSDEDRVKKSASLMKEIQNKKMYIEGLEKKLSNEDFARRAPEQVIILEKEKLEQALRAIAMLEEELKNIED